MVYSTDIRFIRQYILSKIVSLSNLVSQLKLYFNISFKTRHSLKIAYKLTNLFIDPHEFKQKRSLFSNVRE